MLGHLPCETNNADKWKTPINNINNNKEKFIEQNWMIKLIACTNHWILNGSTITLVLSCITISHINQYCKCAQRAKHWQNDLAWDTLYIYICLPQKHIKDPADLFSITGTTLLLSCAAHASLHAYIVVHSSTEVSTLKKSHVWLWWQHQSSPVYANSKTKSFRCY